MNVSLSDLLKKMLGGWGAQAELSANGHAALAALLHASAMGRPYALATALLSQVQQVVPLIKIVPLQAGYPAIYLSDRRCSVGGQLY